MSQVKSFSELLDKLDIVDKKNPSNMSMSSNSILSKYDGDPLFITDISQYRSMVGALQYFTLTRPNISYIVNKLCQFLHCYTLAHLITKKRLLQYFKGIMQFAIMLHNTQSLVLFVYTNADWASSIDNTRSIVGYCVYMDNSLISQHLGKHKVICRSSIDA